MRRSLGAAADAVLLVVRAGRTKRDALTYAMDQLTAARAPVIGTLLNDIDAQAQRLRRRRLSLPRRSGEVPCGTVNSGHGGCAQASGEMSMPRPSMSWIERLRTRASARWSTIWPGGSHDTPGTHASGGDRLSRLAPLDHAILAERMRATVAGRGSAP